LFSLAPFIFDITPPTYLFHAISRSIIADFAIAITPFLSHYAFVPRSARRTRTREAATIFTRRPPITARRVYAFDARSAMP
jgi:hypothetical protein